MNEMMKRKKDSRGEWNLMAESHGYVMVRCGIAVPVVMSRKEWLGMWSPEEYDRDRGVYDKVMLRP